MPSKKILLLCLLPIASASVAVAQQAAPTTDASNAIGPHSRFFFKVGAHKGAVLVVYVTADFQELYIWEKEAMLEPLFKTEQAKTAALTTLALRDAKSGKTIGTYAPKTGVSML